MRYLNTRIKGIKILEQGMRVFSNNPSVRKDFLTIIYTPKEIKFIGI